MNRALRLVAIIFLTGVTSGCGKKNPAGSLVPPVELSVFTLEFNPEPGREFSEPDKDVTVRNLQARLSAEFETVRVRRVEGDRITIDAGPDLRDEDLESILASSGRLSFHMAHPSYREYMAETNPAEVNVPGASFLPYRDPEEIRYLLVNEQIEIRGDQVERAQVMNDYNQWNIQFTLDEPGGDRLHELSKQHNLSKDRLGLPFAIVLDGEILAAPTFTEPVPGGAVQISGSFTEAEARRLASSMQTPLSIPLRLLSEKGEPPSE